ncbi:hypothetical protein [Streptomyces sp. NPDC046759]|uniref:hypothetical protein n=1 Tax=Streptomyces sp. NPDC046759 TaxID=3155019 RepID=UPI0033D98DCF
MPTRYPRAAALGGTALGGTALGSTALGGTALGGAQVTAAAHSQCSCSTPSAAALADALRSCLDVRHTPPRSPGEGTPSDLCENRREFTGRPRPWGVVLQFPIVDPVVAAAEAVHGPLMARDSLGGAGPRVRIEFPVELTNMPSPPTNGSMSQSEPAAQGFSGMSSTSAQVGQKCESSRHPP